MTEAEAGRPQGDALDDRTTRARIRDAALAQFAEHGFRGATIRGVAAAAGVSPGAVQTHFPTKDALRQACDDYVVAVISQASEQVADDIRRRNRATSSMADPGFMASLDRELQPVLGYLAMAMVSGSASADRWFEQFYRFLHATLTDPHLGAGFDDSPEVRDLAAVMTAMQLGLAMMLDRVVQTIGVRRDDPQAMVRIGRARLRIATGRLISEEFEARARAALDSYEQASPPRTERTTND